MASVHVGPDDKQIVLRGSETILAASLREGNEVIGASRIESQSAGRSSTPLSKARPDNTCYTK